MKHKIKLNFATIVFLIGLIVSCLYLVTYLFPVTDNAFVVNDVTPVAAMVDGYISQIYVTNGQKLHKGDKILQIYPKTYELAYTGAKAQYDQSIVGLQVIQKRLDATKLSLSAAENQLKRMQYEYGQKNDISVSKAISTLELRSLEYNIQTQKDTVKALAKEVELTNAELIQATTGIATLKAFMDKTALDLKDTLVTAKTDGYIQSMDVGIGTPVHARVQLFAFVDSTTTYIQANLNETDLAHVKTGDKVLIYPRAYLWHKIFHGVVIADFWAVDRQHKNPIADVPIVVNENKWMLLPQRFPVQIKVLDTNDDYLLRPGMSAYVYIQTK